MIPPFQPSLFPRRELLQLAETNTRAGCDDSTRTGGGDSTPTWRAVQDAIQWPTDPVPAIQQNTSFFRSKVIRTAEDLACAASIIGNLEEEVKRAKKSQVEAEARLEAERRLHRQCQQRESKLAGDLEALQRGHEFEQLLQMQRELRRTSTVMERGRDPGADLQ